MSSAKQDPNSTAALTGSKWVNLYRVGAAAPLITIVFYLCEFLLIPWEKYPASTEAWFSLFQESKILGLLYLNALDIFSIALLGVMFLALYMALRGVNESYMAIAAFFAFLGVAVFIVPRVAMLSLLPLSDRYAAAATEVERARLLAAGETLGALGNPTPQTIGFLFMAIAVLIISLIMLKSDLFSRITAYLGILASALTFGDHLSIIMAPALATALMVISALFWIPWWLMISRGLFQVARRQE
ncbi:MAG: DUF4386 domain-containing protein [Anaerolineales bacterium]|nr:DUF4386 domain-containing protein [Anaerolineales bacterium]